MPFLSDIPLLGYLFSDTTKDKERDELIIMIQPTVIETDADQLAANEAEKQRTILGREAVEAANGAPGELPKDNVSEYRTTTSQEIAPAPQIDTKSVTIRAYNSKSGTSIHTTTTTTNTITRVPTSVMTPLGPTTPTGPVPALSSPAPDVGNGKMPAVNPPSPTPSPTQTP